MPNVPVESVESESVEPTIETDDAPTPPPVPMAKSGQRGGFSRGLGHKFDKPDPRDIEFTTRKLFGAPRALPPEASLEPFLLDIKDQGQTSSCVGHGIGTCIITRLRKMGLTYAQDPSRLAIYDFARSKEKGKSDSYADEGCFPRDAMKALRDQGVPPLAAWPGTDGGYTAALEKNINTPPPWDVLQQAATFRIQAWWSIDSIGASRVEDICHAIAQGYPVVFGTEVDQAFMDYDGKGLAMPAGKQTAGGHCMCFVGYRTVDGMRQLRGVNSWGIGWGDKGLYWAHPNFAMDARASDFYVLQVG